MTLNSFLILNDRVFCPPPPPHPPTKTARVFFFGIFFRMTERKNKEAEIIVQRIIEEKDGLKQENQELQSLCEELMAIIEAGTNDTNKNQGVISS